MNTATTKKANGYKIVLIGDCSVGKTALVERISNSVFSENYKATIGSGHTYWSTTIDGRIIDVQIWDTAGEERFASLAPIYYKDAKAAMVVYSVDNEKSAENVDKWLERFRDTVPGDVPVMIVCNKIDLEDEKEGKSLNMTGYADEHNCAFMRTSAKSGEGVKDAFVGLLSMIKGVVVKETELELKENKKGCC